jgi:hypothetical protein
MKISSEDKATLIIDLIDQDMTIEEMALKCGYTGKSAKDSFKKFVRTREDFKEVQEKLDKLVILEIDQKKRSSLTKYDRSNTNLEQVEEIQKMKAFFTHFQEDYKNLKNKVEDLESLEKKFKSLEGKLDGIVAKPPKGDIEGLHIPDEYKKTTETEVDRVTYRINKDVREKFDIFCQEHKLNYKKTSILSYALDEFMKRYK